MKSMQNIIAGAMSCVRPLEIGSLAWWQSSLESAMMSEDFYRVNYSRARAKRLTLQKLANDHTAPAKVQQDAMAQIRTVDFELATYKRDWLPQATERIANCREMIRSM